MLSNIVAFTGIVISIIVVGLVVAVLVSLFSVLRLMMKQAELKLEADPTANPFKDDKKPLVEE